MISLRNFIQPSIKVGVAPCFRIYKPFLEIINNTASRLERFHNGLIHLFYIILGQSFLSLRQRSHHHPGIQHPRLFSPILKRLVDLFAQLPTVLLAGIKRSIFKYKHVFGPGQNLHEGLDGPLPGDLMEDLEFAENMFLLPQLDPPGDDQAAAAGQYFGPPLSKIKQAEEPRHEISILGCFGVLQGRHINRQDEFELVGLLEDLAEEVVAGDARLHLVVVQEGGAVHQRCVLEWEAVRGLHQQVVLLADAGVSAQLLWVVDRAPVRERLDSQAPSYMIGQRGLPRKREAQHQDGFRLHQRDLVLSLEDLAGDSVALLFVLSFLHFLYNTSFQRRYMVLIGQE